MKRLLFLHIGKAGGTSVGKWLEFDSNPSIYHYDSARSNRESVSVRADAFAANVIHVHGVETGFASHFNEEQWQLFLSDTARFCVIRDPIAKFESDFRYAIQESSPHQIPYVSGFRVESTNPLRCSSADYFSQSDLNRLGANEWVELMYDYYCLSLGRFGSGNGYFQHRYAGTLSELEIKQDSPYLNLKVLNSQFLQANFWFVDCPEAQYSEIERHLGKDFLREPRHQEGFDILLPTEMLDNLFSMLVIRLEWFRAFTVFRDKPLESSDYCPIVNYLAGSRSNITDDNLREESRLNPRSRILFYDMSRKSYVVWYSAIIHCAQQLQLFLSLT